MEQRRNLLGRNLPSTILLQYNSNSRVEIDLRMSIIKPLHAQWLVNIYTYFTSASHVILKGWKKAGISGLLDGTTTLPPEDPFEQIYTD